jgi:hypothetical protein
MRHWSALVIFKSIEVLGLVARRNEQTAVKANGLAVAAKGAEVAGDVVRTMGDIRRGVPSGRSNKAASRLADGGGASATGADLPRGAGSLVIREVPVRPPGLSEVSPGPSRYWRGRRTRHEDLMPAAPANRAARLASSSGGPSQHGPSNL